MRYLAGLLAVALVLCGGAAGQTFSTATGFDAEHRVVGAATTADGGFVVVFRADRHDQMLADDFSVIVRLDEYGTVLWERRIASDDLGGPIRSFDVSADGTLMLTGRANGRRGDSDAWVARLDAQGEFLWQFAFGGPWDEIATAVRSTSDGGAIVVGDAETRGNKRGEIFALKLSPSGNSEWGRYFGSDGDVRSTDVSEACDGYFIVGSQNLSGLALHLSADGQVKWARRSDARGFESLALSNDGDGFAAVSHPNTLSRIDADGVTVWQREYLSAGALFEVSQSESGFLIGGSSDFWWAAGVTDLGESIWASQIIPAGPPFLGEVHAIVGLPDGGSFTVAEIRSPDFIWAFRLDQAGQSCSPFLGAGSGTSVESQAALYPISLNSRSANGLKIRGTDYRSQDSQPIWGEANVCPI